MCGIAGIFCSDGIGPEDERRIERMTRALAHRGPDDEGIYVAGPMALGHRRLSIIDLGGGHQPMSNEDQSIWITYNGEVFNFPELRRDLVAAGVRFRTTCDTEVIIHLYDREGPDSVARLNGQFALAIWDSRRRRLFLARDQFGILPLFYARVGSRFLFGSEIKALLAAGLIEPRLDVRGLDSLTSFGAVLAPLTMFRGVSSLRAGHWMIVTPSGEQVQRYYDVEFPPAGAHRHRTEEDWREGLLDQLRAAVSRRLLADVPVGLYLSGGIDSSAVGAVMAEVRGGGGDQPWTTGRTGPLVSFSVGFRDRSLDETDFATVMAQRIGAEPRRIMVDDQAICDSIVKLLFHTETPMFSVEPGPLMLLSEMTSREMKVVLSGQGADEMFAGYPYYFFDRVRRALSIHGLGPVLWALARGAERLISGRNILFPSAGRRATVERRFGCFPAIQILFGIVSTLKELYSPAIRDELQGYSVLDDAPLDLNRIRGRDPLDQSLYLSYKTFLENYLLSVQGDRPAMAHHVEVRFPFLDPDLVRFSAQIPPDLRYHGRTEKYILRRAIEGMVPEAIRTRRKRPYAAPWGVSFARPDAPPAVQRLLSRAVIEDKGYFDPDVVENYLGAVRSLSGVGSSIEGQWSTALNGKSQALVAYGMGINLVVTTHVWDEVFRGPS